MQTGQPSPGSFWRHSSTGETYRVIGVAVCATNGDRCGVEQSVLYMTLEAYRPDLYYRELSEFMDGRFVPTRGA